MYMYLQKSTVSPMFMLAFMQLATGHGTPLRYAVWPLVGAELTAVHSPVPNRKGFSHTETEELHDS